jgi:hypothetical protein
MGMDVVLVCVLGDVGGVHDDEFFDAEQRSV